MKGLPTFLLFVLAACSNQTMASKSPAIPSDIGPRGEKGDIGSPGLKGESGIAGPVGPPGGPGVSGPRGEKGDTGVGLKGERGIPASPGIPGVKGQKGIAGQRGYSGTPGFKGQKGEMGQSRLSAFSAARSTSFTPSSSGIALPFDRVHTNVGGDFVASSGRFTCDVPGIYLFTYSIGAYTSDPGIKLMKNAVVINSVYKADEDIKDMVSNTAVLQLAAGDVVWLKCSVSGRQIYSDTSLKTTFSGVILHEI
ncbi:complement C1q tumor necrosis factor-related protein 5-like isoform X1 [Amphiura filiformis]|uniref:complement C1q tumor necrosis factor-related protein 5-like isoform X1 n=1 Tax=Amphiura filiformis TaxID=82378 RepID=UPI003B22287D